MFTADDAYYCPICGFGPWEEPFEWSYADCPSCDTDFCQYMADVEADATIRREWIERNGLTPEAFDQLVNHLNIEPQPPSDWPALIFPAALGQGTQIRDLLRNRAPVDGVNKRGETALMWSARMGQREIVTMLIDSSANPNVATTHGRADPRIRDDVSRERRDMKQAPGQTSLMWACEGGHVDVADSLLRAGASVHQGDEWQQTPLMWASEWGHADVVHRLLQAGALVNARDDHGNTALIVAARGDHVQVLCPLIEAGAEVNAVNRFRSTSLHLAIDSGNFEAVQRLVDAGADVNAGDQCDRSPLMYAINDDRLDIADYFIRHGADVNHSAEAHDTALSIAAMGNDRQKSAANVQFLIAAGADVNARGRNHLWPLHSALMCRNVEAAQALLDAGANPSQVNVRGETPLMFAAAGGYADVLRRLLASGADVRARDYSGETALHYAGFSEAVGILTEAGAELDAQGRQGQTSLMKATAKGDACVVRALLEQGANPELKNSEGKTAREIARDKSLMKIASLLSSSSRKSR
jgi:ankyrin repeat protein